MEQVTVEIYPNDTDQIGTEENIILLMIQFSVKITKITDAPNLYFLLRCLNSAKAEKIFSNEFAIALSGINFELSLPNELKYSCTFFVYNADQFILYHSEEEA